MKMFVSTVLAILSGSLLSSATVVTYFSDLCDHNLEHNCQVLPDSVVCYDGHKFQSWCLFVNASCSGKLRPNVTTLQLPIDPTCAFEVLIRIIVPTHSTTTYTPSTFERHFFDAAIQGIDSLLLKANASGVSINEQKKIFTTQDHTHKHYVRNTKCWAYPLDLTSISPWNSIGRSRRAGVLISPRHALWAKHYSMPVNTTIRFVDKENNVVERQIVKVAHVPAAGHSSLSGYDIVIGELDLDVPNTISFAKVMPKDLKEIRPHGVHVPAFDTDFEEKALVADLNYERGNLVWLATPQHSSIRYPFFEPKIVGDSGNPVFLVVDNELILMFVFTYGGAGGGTSITYHHDSINNIMKQWGSHYQLTDADLTKFLDSGSMIPQIIG